MLRQVGGNRTSIFDALRTRIYWKVGPKRVIVLYRYNNVIDRGILSSAGHVKPCMNLPGPSGKAKYS